MPPSAVKTIRDTIYWQYAKLISKSAGMNIAQSRGFQMSTFQKLKKGEIKWSSAIREWIKEHEKPDECVYCMTKGKDLTVEHILPKSCGEPDTPENAIMVCKKCNSKKGGKRLYEWFGHENRDKIPRIAEGKYLKLLYELHEKKGTLDLNESELKKLCQECDMKKRCIEAEKAGKLNVYCLEGWLNRNK